MGPVSLRIEATLLTVVHKALHRLVLITSLVSTTLSFPSGYLPPCLPSLQHTRAAAAPGPLHMMLPLLELSSPDFHTASCLATFRSCPNAPSSTRLPLALQGTTMASLSLPSLCCIFLFFLESLC